ncbi:hypothetical protein NXH76_13405 [Blautia schinkii]|nr:hypothetical protein [Blautia schinkii]
MKKIFNLVTIVLLCTMLITPISAASLSPGKEVIPQEGTITNKDGSKTDISNPEELKEYLNIKPPSVELEKINNYAALNSFDVTLPEEASSAQVVLHVPGVKKGDVVMVRIYVDGQWVNVEAIVIDDDKVQVTIEQSGTIEILKKASSSSSGTDTPVIDNNNGSSSNGTDGHNTSSVSPKTGESNAFNIACILAVSFGILALMAGIKVKKISE